MPGIVNANRHELFDRDIFLKFGNAGLLGPTLPEKYGCLQANYVSYGLMAAEVERVDSSYR